MKQHYAVAGMTCDHCVSAVTQELSSIDGVQGVEVVLVPGGTSSVEVTAESPVPDTRVGEAVAEAGYEVVAVGNAPADQSGAS